MLSALAVASLIGADLGASVLNAPGAQAAEPFPIVDSGMGTAGDLNQAWDMINAKNGVAGASTASGRYTSDGWTRLTDNAPKENINLLNGTQFPSDTGFSAEFDYRMTGTTAAGDGITFYLVDGGAGVTSGGSGSGLGYASNDLAKNSGVVDGFLGVGIDAAGWYNRSVGNSGTTCVRDGNSTTSPGIYLRGPGKRDCNNTQYKLIGGKALSNLRTDSGTVDPATLNGAYKRVRMTVTPEAGGVHVIVALADGATKNAPVGAFVEVLNTSMAATVPNFLKLGFSASTGTNGGLYQDIRNIRIAAATDLALDGGIAEATPGTDGVYLPGDEVQLSYTATNNGPTAIGNPPNGVARVYQNLTDTPLGDVTWSCVPNGGAICEAENGSGPEIVADWSGPKGSSVTINVTGTVKEGVFSGEYPISAVIPTNFENNTLDPALVTVQLDGGLTDTNLANNSTTLDLKIGQIAVASTSTIKATPTTVTANGVATSNLVITTKEGNGTLMTSGGATIMLDPEFGTTSAVQDRGDGTYTSTWVSTKSGEATIGFTLAGVASPSEDVVNFTAGALDLENDDASNYTVSAGDAVVGVENHTIKVTTTDEFGNGVAIDPQRIGAESDPVENVSITAFTATAGRTGEYTAEVSSTVAGSKIIAVEIDGTPVRVNAEATNTVAKFIAGSFDLAAAGSGYSVTGGDQSIEGGAHQVTVTLTDAHGNPVTLSSADLKKLIGSAPAGSGVTVGEFSAGSTAGSYTADITSTKVVEAEITVALDGATVNPAAVESGTANITATFTSGGPATDNAKTNFEVSTVGAQPVVTGKHTVLVRVADADGNPVKNLVEGAFDFAANPEEGVSFENFSNRGNGEYTMDVVSDSSGEKVISVRIGAGNVSPVSAAKAIAEFEAGDPSVTNAFWTNYTVSDDVAVAGVDSQTVTVKLADNLGNPIRNASASLDLNVTGLGTGTKTPFVETDEPGTYIATITSTVAGSKPVTVNVGELEIPLLPTGGVANAVFVEGAPSANSSELSVDRVSVQAIASDAAIATVTLKDAFGNMITDVPAGTEVKISTNFGTASHTVAGTEAGTFTASISSTEVGTAIISYSVNSTQASTTKTVEFVTVAAPVVDYANGSVVTGSGKAGDTVIVRDAGGNEIARGKVGIDGTFTVELPAVENGDTLKVSLVEDESGYESDSVEVVVRSVAPEAPVVNPSNGSKVTGTAEPGSKVVVKGPGDVVLCEVTTDQDGKFECEPTPTPGNGDTITVTATDPSNNTSIGSDIVINTVPPVKPEVNPSNGSKITGTTDPGAEIVVTGPNGEILCEVTADQDGKFECVPDPAPKNGDKVTVTAKDKEGNTSKSDDLVINTVPPVKPEVDPSNGSKITGTTDPGAEIVVTGPNGEILCEVTADQDGKFECVPDPAPKNGDKVTVTAKDKEGNTSKSDDLVINTVPPVKPTVNPSNGSKVTGTTDPGAKVEVKGPNGEVLCETIADKNGKFECEPSGDLTNGDTLTVTATDKEGNVSGEGSVVIDTIAPGAPTVNPSNGSKITGSAEAGSKVVVKDSTGKVLCETTADKDGKFSCVPKPSPAHGEKIAVTATDPSGNASAEGSVEINKTAPDAPKLDVSNGKVISGGVIQDGDTVKIVDGNGNEIPGMIVIDSNGRFTFKPTKPLAEGDVAKVIVTNPSGNSVETPVQIKTSKPTAPKVDPVDGETVTGCAEPGSTVTVRDDAGNIIGTAVAGQDCRFEVVLDPAQETGATITVEVTDAAGNVSKSVSVRVGATQLVLKADRIKPGETQVAYGYGFQPSETVNAVLRSTPVELGEQVADANGNVTFTFTVPNSLELGEHSVTLTSEFSGTVKATFTVYEDAAVPVLSVTGGELTLPLGIGALLIISGLALVAVKRRRMA